MEHLVPPVILLLLLRFGFPVIVTWFFEHFVEPRTEKAGQQKSPTINETVEESDAQKIAATREELAELRQRLGNANDC